MPSAAFFASFHSQKKRKWEQTSGLQYAEDCYVLEEAIDGTSVNKLCKMLTA